MNVRKILCVFLALILLFSLSACKEKSPEPDIGATNSQTVTPPDKIESQPTATTDNAVSFFSMTYGETLENSVYLTVYSLDGSTMQIEYAGAEKKIGTCNNDALLAIANAFINTKLADLNSQEVYEEGESSGSMYVEFADGTIISANFSGNIPEEFIEGFSAMESCFQNLTADLPVYIPEPVIMGEVDPVRLEELQTILNASGIQNLDAFIISEVPVNDEFTFLMGLESADGIVGGSSVGGSMMTDAYSLSIVTLEDESNIQNVRNDFQKNMNWTKWVCVMPTHALIAQKGNMVLCLMGADAQFENTKTGIEAAGWENFQILEPDF